MGAVQYTGEWTARSPALRPRPSARAVARIAQHAQNAMDAHEWRAAPADAAVAERIAQSLDGAHFGTLPTDLLRALPGRASRSTSPDRQAVRHIRRGWDAVPRFALQGGGHE
ncbi:hypothetical protein R6V09_11515 [Streptomyces sp. W16]|uniref:hypothetical protein n=1 Tax=Streptomyces sp. W16 TaxID=3076631 RepID=UPI00295BFA1F|nr:hypothetical protein [Streptomyces sp. W16]MDV9170758.1 hypothetical protein [Streptomyces sp. W16]